MVAKLKRTRWRLESSPYTASLIREATELQDYLKRFREQFSATVDWSDDDGNTLEDGGLE